MYTIERYHDISSGHRVVGHNGKCEHLHGHNYRITFTCASAELDAQGMVLDFSVVKDILCHWLEEVWDHKFLVWYNDPLKEKIIAADIRGVAIVPFNPTAENIAEYLVTTVGPNLLRETGVVLVQCRVEETRKCSATYALPVNQWPDLIEGKLLA